MVAPDFAPSVSASAVSTSTVSAPSVPDDLPLFVFGSLRDADMLALVLGTAPTHVATEPAGLGGFRCHRAGDSLFPLLVPQPWAMAAEMVVSGLLLHGLTSGDLERILFYEGGDYALRPVAVTSTRAPRRRTRARVFLATGLLCDSGVPWDFAAWTETDKPLALALTGDLMARYGASAGDKGDRGQGEGAGTRHDAGLAGADAAGSWPEVYP